MTTLSMTIAPGPQGTRVLGTDGNEVCLKGRLESPPKHPRALKWLLESVALWQGRPVRAVLCAGGRHRTYATAFRADWFTDFGGPLYRLEVVDEQQVRRAARLRDPLSGFGTFADLKQLRIWDAVGKAPTGGER